MDVNILNGLLGALVGGLFLSATVSLIFAYEKKQANKKSDKLMGDLKSIYAEKLNQGLIQVNQKVPSNKFN